MRSGQRERSDESFCPPATLLPMLVSLAKSFAARSVERPRTRWRTTCRTDASSHAREVLFRLVARCLSVDAPLT